MKIAVDLMGGDRAPDSIISGINDALRERSMELILVGDGTKVKDYVDAAGSGGSVTFHRSGAIAGMDEDISSVLKKSDTSIGEAFGLVSRGEAKAVVSAGNSMATVAVGIHVLGKIDGIKRPALASCFEAEKGKCVILDLGSSVDSSPQSLVEFAHMGASYAKVALRLENPRVALISNGQEDIKGNKATKAANSILKQDRRLNYMGFIEGSQIYKGVADVIVCDGFVGNTILKSSEGMVNAVLKKLSSDRNIKNNGCMERFTELLRDFDFSNYGGAVLLGLNGPCIVCHGDARPSAIKNAIFHVSDLLDNGFAERFEEEYMKSIGLSN